MALFKKLFSKKPLEGLVEISERVYVFSSCFSTDIWEDNVFKGHIEGILGKLRGHFPDVSFMVFNFREGEHQSRIASIMAEYNMTVMDYPRQYEGCPILTIEVIRHFLKSSENWFSLGQHNLILMHCERGGWPVLAFLLAALMLYRKQSNSEQKTLELIYKRAPRELLQLTSPLNPIPSQIRYLQYVSRSNTGSQWPPSDKPLTLDCVILRSTPNMDGEGGCRPIFRIYGHDPLMATDKTPKVLFSTPKKSKLIRYYRQADNELAKIDIRCHIVGDVVVECFSLDGDRQRELMMFRVVFNTAFIKSHVLMLNREEIDVLWNSKDRFPKDFRAEVVFSDMDTRTSAFSNGSPGVEEKGGLPMEAFAKVQEIFSNGDWLSPTTDVANVLQHIPSERLQEKLETVSLKEKSKSQLIERIIPSQKYSGSEKESTLSFKKLDENASRKKFEPQEIQVAPQKSAHCSRPPSVPIKGKTELQVGQQGAEHCKTSIQPSAEANSSRRKVEIQESQVAPQQPAQFKPTMDANSVRKKIEPQEEQIRKKTEPQEEQIQPLTSSAQSLSLSDTLLLMQHSVPSLSLSDTHLLMQQSVPSLSLSDTQLLMQHSVPSLSLSDTQLLMQHSAPSHSFLNPPSYGTQSTSEAALPPGSVLSYAIGNSASTPSALPPRSVSSYPIENSASTPSGLPPRSVASYPIENSASSQSDRNPPPPLTSEPPSPSVPHALPPSSSASPAPPVKSPPPPPPPPNVASSNTTAGPPPPPPPPLASGGPPMPPPPVPPPHPSGPSLPPPPAPPGLSRAKPVSVSSGNIPSIPGAPGPPPPPAPGLSRATSVSVPSAPGAPGPPPPGAPLMRGRSMARVGSKNQTQTKKANLKPYHWMKLTRVSQGSLWAEAQKPEEAAKAPEFDMSELESLFSAVSPTAKNKPGKSNNNAASKKPDKVQLIELRRAYNCEIMLTKVKIPLPELTSAILALDDAALDPDQIENLIKFCPTKEEIELLKNYKGDIENLGKCEQFFLELMKVPRVEAKLRVFLFKIQFYSQVSDLRNGLDIVNAAVGEVRNSVKLKRIMQTILSLGNALNQGTARGSAVGFRLDSLLKLTDTRARNNKMTLMHYLCKVLKQKMPELLDFPKDLATLEAATKIQLKFLADETQAISKGLEKVIQELSASEKDGPVSASFCKTVKAFLSFAEGEVKSLTSLHSYVGKNADGLANYFGEDPARCPFEQVMATLLSFSRTFVKAHEENCKQLELDMKKAKEAEKENEKLKK
ncbi:hypothetical protein HRI_004445800 [Hibiscus trionum]|uniref:Formin-like protein n=1 Tax=Hibiscus trionum TaxID=183268 RepID=A0A9W7MSN6_HIBTR|nr:hypothetical protein HRI_004445800 [Hibiscus trionum]